MRRQLLHCRLHATGGSLIPHNQRKCSPAKIDAQNGATTGQDQAIVHSRKTEAWGLRRRKPQLGGFADFQRRPRNRLLHNTRTSLIIFGLSNLDGNELDIWSLAANQKHMNNPTPKIKSVQTKPYVARNPSTVS